MKNVLTYSALNVFRNCPRKYHLRYVECLRRPERPDTLEFGSIIHDDLEHWYRLVGDPHRLLKTLALIDEQFPHREHDPQQRYRWHLVRAMFEGYAARYPQEPFEIVEIEKEFTAEIRNPGTGRPSQTFVIAGKVDGIVRLDGELYLIEHKTASSLTGDYLDRLWCDSQIALYCHYLRELGFPIVGVIYNVLLKTRLKQREGETQQEYEARRAALAAKNKSGRSTAQRQMPETDLEFRARLTEWHARPEAYHRERIYLSGDRLALLQEEVWTVTQQYLDAKRRGTWLLNTSHCFSFQRPCEYLPYCQSGFSPNVRDNLYEVAPPHEELAQLTVSAADDTGF